MNIEAQSGTEHLIGLISDTHGMVRPDVHTVLAGVELILHAGDVGEGVLSELRTIAPVRAVFGNTDPPGYPDLEEAIDLVVGGVSIHVSHGHETGSPKPEKLSSIYGSDVIVYGHTHRQLIFEVGGRLVINPGAAGARRFSLSPSVGLLRIAKGTASAEIVSLDD